MEVNGQLHTLAALPPGKEPLIPIGYEAEWAPDPVWTLWHREKSLASAGNRTSVVLSYPGSILGSKKILLHIVKLFVYKELINTFEI
jgi:hypothetical protein